MLHGARRTRRSLSAFCCHGAAIVGLVALAVAGGCTIDLPQPPARPGEGDSPPLLAVPGVALPERATASLGQGGLLVAASVRNDGGRRAEQLTASLLFLAVDGTDLGGFFASAADPTNPAVLAGGVTSELRFHVSVAADAPAGVVQVGARASGVDPSGARPQVTALATTAVPLTLQAPAGLEIRALRITPPRADQGQDGVLVELEVANPGQAATELESPK